MTSRGLFIGALLSGLIVLPTAVEAQPSGGVEWRVKDRYRLFGRASADAKVAVTGLFDEIAGEPPSAPISRFQPALLRTLSGHGEAAASLRSSNYDQVDERPGRSSGRYRRDYLWPERYFIEIRDTRPRRSQLCTYLSAIETASDRPCGEWTTLAVADGRATSASAWSVDTIVRVRSGSSEASIPISFRDELIVALGDSYLSGEGNPDAPSRVTKNPDPVFRRYSWGGRLTPAQVLEAEWWDEPCHRSLLSWPVLASLVYSARNPHRAVTLIHLGCSGAVSEELDLRGQRDLPGGGNEPLSQLQLLGGLLEPPSAGWGARGVGTTFLSIGGNDVGFSGVIATIALPPNGYTLGGVAARAIGAAADAVCPYNRTGRPLSRLCRTSRSSEARLAAMPQSLLRLASNLDETGIAANRTFQLLYPNSLLTAEGLPCDTRPSDDESGFESLMGAVPRFFRGLRFRTWGYELQYEPEREPPDSWGTKSGWIDPSGRIKCDWAPEQTDSEVCQAIWVHASLNQVVARAPWQIVSDHLPEMARRGFCNRSPQHPRALPLVENGAWRNGWTPQSADPHDPDSPRWFNLPNDSVLTQYGFYGRERRFRNGSVHPTFRGHVELAETAYEAAFGRQ